MTTTCPTPDDLRALLDDRLAADSESGLLAHIDGCTRCQRALETLTANDLPSAVRLARPTRTVLSAGGPPAGSGPELGRPERIGPYRVCRELGRGGMGVVYLGTHTRLRREAAVKLIRAGASARAEDIARFRREAEVVAAVAHPNVVAVYEAGEQDDIPWLALEYVSGGSLREYTGGRPLPPEAAAEIARGLARGAAAVHAAGMVHRDIKPANVMLAPVADGPMVPKLTDFGLAKDVAGAGVTLSGAVIGTPHYMAPEQTRAGCPIGPTTDVYGIGAVLYETLTGGPPFNGADPIAVLHQVATREPVPVRHLQPAVPRDLQTICHKCLEKDPARRYHSADALAEDLGRFLDGRPISARPVGAVEFGWRSARRNPVLSALAVTLVAAVAAGVGGVAWKWREAAAERDKTAAAERDTAAERDAAVAARTAARRQSALALLDKGIAAAEAGRVGEGLVWMAEALTAAPADDADLDRVVRTNLAGWLAHAPRVRSIVPLAVGEFPVALTPDGRSLLTRTTQRLRLHDLAPGAGPATEAGFNPRYGGAVSADGRFLLVSARSATGNWGLAGWDTAARRTVEPTFPAAALPDWTVPAPIGTVVAVKLVDEQVILLDLATNRPVLGPLRHPKSDERDDPRVTALAFAADGKTVFTWTADSAGPSCHAWDVATGTRTDAPFGGRTVRRAAFSPDGLRLVTVADDGTARQWDAAVGVAVGLPLPSVGEVTQVTFSPDGRFLVLVAENGSVRWWDVVRGDLVAPPTVGPVAWLALRGDGGGLVTADTAERVAWVWDLPRAAARTARLPGPRADARLEQCPARTAGGAGLRVSITGGHHAPVRGWDARSERPVPVPLRLLGRSVSAVASAPDGRWLAAATIDPDPVPTEVHVWDAVTGGPTARIPQLNWTWRMEATSDGRALVSGGYDRLVSVWDPATGQALGPPTPAADIGLGLAVAPDGRSVALARNHGRGLVGPAVFDLARAPFSFHRAWEHRAGTPAEVVQFTPDGGHVVGYHTGEMEFIGRRGEVQRWDARTGEPAGPAVGINRVRAVALAADGRTALVASGGAARVWDLATGAPVGPPLAHPSSVTACAFLPPLGLAVCGCDDGSARAWDLRTGRAIGPPLTHGPAVTAVAFDPDGRTVRTAAIDGSVRTWAVPEPVAGDPESVRRAVTRRTALALDPAQHVGPLTAAAWTAAPLAELPDGALAPTAWHAARARDAEVDGAWSVAAYHLDRITVDGPGARAEVLARRARCDSAVGRFTEATAWYARAAAHAPGDWLTEWYTSRAIESGADGNWKTAAWYVARLAEVRPGDPDLLVARAEVRYRLGEVDGWAEDVTRAAGTAGELCHWANRAAECGRWALAADLLERAADPALHLTLRAAVARLKAGDTVGYARICKRVEAEVRDNWSPAQLNAAAWLLSLAPGGAADPARLARLMISAVGATADPKQRHGYANTLGAVLIRAGRCAEAVVWIERGVAAGGQTDPEDAALLSVAHRRLGDDARAAERLAEARETASRKQYSTHRWPDRAPRELLIAEAAALSPPVKQDPLPNSLEPPVR